ncbi:MAG: hypothetical protein QMB59_04465, partial [Bacteroidales bacterium]
MLLALALSLFILSSCGVSSYYASSGNYFDDGIYYRPRREMKVTRLAAQNDLNTLRSSDRYSTRQYATDTLFFDENGNAEIQYDPDKTYLIYQDGESYESRLKKFDDPTYSIVVDFDDDYDYYGGWYGYNPWWSYSWYPYYGYSYNRWRWGYNPWYYSSFYSWYDPWYYGGWYDPYYSWSYGWYDPWYYDYYGWGWGGRGGWPYYYADYGASRGANYQRDPSRGGSYNRFGPSTTAYSRRGNTANTSSSYQRNSNDFSTRSAAGYGTLGTSSYRRGGPSYGNSTNYGTTS